MTYSDKLKDPRWQKKRLEIFQRDNWKCSLCDDSSTTLHLHHKKYSGYPWEAEDIDLTTLCEDCHNHEELMKKFPGYTTLRIVKIVSSTDTAFVIAFQDNEDGPVMRFTIYSNNILESLFTMKISSLEYLIKAFNIKLNA